jgi:hypothetical protein
MNTITLDKASYLPGDSLQGRVRWKLEKAPKKLELRLFWYTRGRGTEESEHIASRELDRTDTGDTAFSFTLPEWPWSTDGKLISIRWAIELVHGKEGLALADFTMSPTGTPVALPPIEKPDSEAGLGFWAKWLHKPTK